VTLKKKKRARHRHPCADCGRVRSVCASCKADIDKVVRELRERVEALEDAGRATDNRRPE